MKMNQEILISKFNDDYSYGNQISIEKHKRDFMKIIIIILKNIGLFIINMSYIVGGAFLFQSIEQYGEIRNCYEGSGTEMAAIMSSKEYVVNYIMHGITTNPLDTTKDNLTDAFAKIKSSL